MKFTERLQAAYNAIRGKAPQGRAIPEPFFFNFTAGMSGVSTQNHKINHVQLRAFSESPVVRRAIDYIRNQVTRLDWDIELKPGAKRWTSAQRKDVQTVKNVLSKPNQDDNWMSWLGQMIEDMLVIGQGASEVKEWTGHPTRPILLYPVDAASIQIYMTWDGSPSKPRYAQADWKGHFIDFKDGEMLVMKHNPRSNSPFGLSPTEVAVQQIQYFLDAQSYAGKTASNATPKKLLWMGQQITEKQVVEFRTYFKDEIEGRSHIPIIGGNDEPKSIELGLASDQAIFLQWQSFLVALIANAFNLDIMKFNAIVGINRSTGDTLDDVSDEGAIRPMAEQIEHYINQYILERFGIADVARFKFRYTTSYQDRKSLSVIHQIDLQDDKITINEARRESGYPDLPFDERVGKSKGDFTLSEYRSIYGGIVTLQDAVGVDEDTKTTSPQSVEGRTKVAQETAKAKADAKVQTTNGTNNGVHGAPNATDKPMNQRTDKSLSTT